MKMELKEKIENFEEELDVKMNLDEEYMEYHVDATHKKQVKNVACFFIDHDVEFFIEEGSYDLLVVKQNKFEDMLDRLM
jgi:hypothetical protein